MGLTRLRADDEILPALTVAEGALIKPVKPRLRLRELVTRQVSLTWYSKCFQVPTLLISVPVGSAVPSGRLTTMSSVLSTIPKVAA